MKLSKLNKAKLVVLREAHRRINTGEEAMICLAVRKIRSDGWLPLKDTDVWSKMDEACLDILNYIRVKLADYDQILSVFVRRETQTKHVNLYLKDVRLRWITAMALAVKTQTEVKPDWK
jgi:hypothetical protein